VSEPISPECAQEKCRNCDGDALDEANDDIVQCQCGCHTFQRINDDLAESGRP
jgi:hypothetical protein